MAKARTITGSSGQTTAAVPTLEYSFKHDELTIFRELIFYFKNGKIIAGEVVEFVVNKKDGVNKEQLISKMKDNQIPKFTGAVLRYSLLYASINGKAFKNGVTEGNNSKIEPVKKSNSSLPSSANNVGNSNAMSTTSGGDCIAGTDYFWVTTYPDGTQTWDYMYTICREWAVNTNGDSGGNGGLTYGEEEVDGFDLAAESELKTQVYSSISQPAETNISFPSPDLKDVPFDWVVVENSGHLWKVTSYDIARGARPVTGPVLYDIQHSKSSISGQTEWNRIRRRPGGPTEPFIKIIWLESSANKFIASDYKSRTMTVSGGLYNFQWFITPVSNKFTVIVQ